MDKRTGRYGEELAFVPGRDSLLPLWDDIDDVLCGSPGR